MAAGETIQATQGHGSVIEGEAIVSHDPLHWLRTFDLTTGVGQNREHDLYRKSVKGKILVFHSPTSGASAAGAFLEMVRNHAAPLAVVANEIDPSTISGFLMSGVPVISDFSQDVTDAILSGDRIRVDPVAKTVTIIQPVG